MGLPLKLGERLAGDSFEVVRRRAIFECCKWDPQVEDLPALSPWPLLLEPGAWSELQRMAESLAAEALSAEAELLRRPDLHRRLGLPLAARRALARASRQGPPVTAARVVRFDFHLTTEGWRISEANTDVPGGFIEASGFTRLMAELCPGSAPGGDPAEALASSLGRRSSGGPVALVHATAYVDDRQVMEFLARRLESSGLRAVLVSPAHLRWRGGLARLETDWLAGPVEAVVRFFPAEWLPNLPSSCGWREAFAGGLTPQSNPPTALLTQSKRFPLVWDLLETPLPTWRALLPETQDPRDAPLRRGGWVLKPALGRMGEGVAVPGVTEAGLYRRTALASLLFPRHWAAQRLFESLPLSSPEGDLHPCLGVFVVDGRACGVYGRLARRPIIDGRAQDAAVLIGAPEEVLVP